MPGPLPTESWETSDEWIRERTGIEQRHRVEGGVGSGSDLALHASEHALERAGLRAATIPIATHEAVDQSLLDRGDLLLPAFGNGFTWASAAIPW